MPQTGLGIALKILRERRKFSLREVSLNSFIDHAYVYRLETGEKTNPSHELIDKLLATYKPSERDVDILKWLVDHPETDPKLVEFVIKNDTIDIDVFYMAAGIRHRGIARPDPATLIARIRRALEEDDEDD